MFLQWPRRRWAFTVLLLLFHQMPDLACADGLKSTNALTHKAPKKRSVRITTKAPPPKPEHFRIASPHHVSNAGGGLISTDNGMMEKSTSSEAYIKIQSPTENAFQLIELQPGANVSSSDPSGLSWQTDISVRGIQGSDLGYLLEGMPVGDAAYGGGTPSQWADSENYKSVTLNQEGGEIDDPLLQAAGGVLSMNYINPARKAGVKVGFTYGTFNTDKEFVRLDTGVLGATKIRAFASYSYTQSNQWRGPGQNIRNHVDFKAIRPFGDNDKNAASVVMSFNRADIAYYPKVNLSQWESEGKEAGLLAPHFDPQNAVGGSNYYPLYRSPFQTIYAGAPINYQFTPHLSFKAEPYGQYIFGNGPTGDQFLTSGNYSGYEQPIPGSFNPPVDNDGWGTYRDNYSQKTTRDGVTLTLKHDLKWNHFTLGYWYDHVTDSEKMNYVPVQQNGYAPNIWGDNPATMLHLPNGQVWNTINMYSVTHSNSAYVEDRIELPRGFTLMGGFKEVIESIDPHNLVPGPQKSGRNTYAIPLPRAGFLWKLGAHDQIFGNGVTNFRTPSVTAYYDTYNLTNYGDPNGLGGISGYGAQNLKNEYAINEEFGWRHTGRYVITSLTFFNYNFTNRLISSVNDRNIQTTINAGGQTSRGVDGAIGFKPVRGFSPYLSFEYLDAVNNNDLPVDGTYLPTKGKKAIEAPEFSGSIGLRYDWHGFFSMITAHYKGPQYSTFMNDESIPGYATAELAFGYHGKDFGPVKAPSWRLNFNNLSNQTYLSGVGTPTFNAKDTRAVNGTIIQGQSPKYYIDGGFGVTGSLSAGF
ncbi:TonB-dependent receptor [Acetobacteraceae bacterium]|nr:TonB-dependent receptor [Acetobacteraceae bacterium]